MTQVNSLRRFAERGDAEAFAQIVEQYQRLVFATCRRSLHHPADIDDAVQETFLRLAQKAGELHANLGGWLYRCAANVSTDINRRRDARRRHESAAAKTSAQLEDNDAQRQLAELREHLDAALQKIDAEQAELIIERYFAGRSQTELAAELGLSPAAISYRLDRAVDAMRQQLSTMGCAVAVAGSAAAVASVLDAEQASAAVPSALTANIMKIGLGAVPSSVGASFAFLVRQWIWHAVIGVAAIVGLVFGIVYATRLHPPAPALEQSPVLLAQAVIAPSAAPPSAPPAAAPQAPALTVGPDHGGQGAAAPNWQTTQPSALRAVLSGRILDEDGKPVPNATVTLQSGPTPSIGVKTDDEGNYAFMAVDREGEYRIGVEATGFLPITPFVSTDPGVQLTSESRARRDMVLQRGVSLMVTVAEADGKPVPKAGVDVNAVGGDRRNSVANRKLTDALGHAHFDLPFVAAGYLVDAEITGFAPAHSVVKFNTVGLAQKADLTLSPGISVPGIALYSDGKPAAGDKIVATPDWWSSAYIPNSSPIDAAGNFTLTDIGPGDYSISLMTGNTGRPVTTVTLPPATQPLRITMPFASPSGKSLTGRVRFVGGRPASVTVLAMRLDGGPGFYNATIQPYRLGQSGPVLPSGEVEFSIPNLPAGSYRLDFHSDTIEDKVIDRFDFPGDLPLVELHVIAKPQLTGTVTDAASGEPITHFAIRVKKISTLGAGQNYTQDNHWTQVSDPQGHFSVQLVGPGVYQAQVSLDGFAWAWSAETTVEKGTVEVPIKVTPGGSLSGVVLDPAGQPLAGAQVIPLSMAKSISSRDEQFDSDAGAVVTDAQGRFTLAHLAGGTETIKVTSQDAAPLIVSKLKVVEEQSTDAGSLRMQTGGTVEGTVYDSDGNPLPGATLEFMNRMGYSPNEDEVACRVAMVTTDENGKYHVEHLPHQMLYVTYTFLDERNHEGVVRRAVFPVDGKTARLDFGGTVPVTGRLVSAAGPMSDISLQLFYEDDFFGPLMVTATAGADGRFAFHGPPEGQFILAARSTQNRSAWLHLSPVNVNGQPQELGDVPMDLGDVVIKINADDPGELQDLHYVTIVYDASGFQRDVAVAGPTDHDQQTWKAAGVPPGKWRAHFAYGSNADGVSYTLPFERKAGAAETDVTLHLPAATAMLTTTVDNTTATTARISFQTADGSVEFGQYRTGAFKVPPGTYQAVDNSIVPAPRTDIAPVTLEAGESRQIKLEPQPTTPMPKDILVRIWTAEGLQILDAVPQVFDAAGKAIEVNMMDQGTVFVLGPGQYKVVIARPGKAPCTKEFSVPLDQSPLDVFAD